MISHCCLVLDVILSVSLLSVVPADVEGRGKAKRFECSHLLVCKDFYASFLLYSVNMVVCDQLMRVCRCNLRPHPTQE